MIEPIPLPLAAGQQEGRAGSSRRDDNYDENTWLGPAIPIGIDRQKSAKPAPSASDGGKAGEPSVGTSPSAGPPKKPMPEPAPPTKQKTT